jgi:speckle-type POZ protein
VKLTFLAGEYTKYFILVFGFESFEIRIKQCGFPYYHQIREIYVIMDEDATGVITLPETIGNGPMMIVPYEWILENVGEEPMTMASKMISFRGEKVFRVGLKNHAISPILFFMAVDLVNFGMKVQDVKSGIQSSGFAPAKMMEMTKEYIGEDENLQLFTIDLGKMVTGQRTFVFRICIVGTNPGYSYQLSDRLAKDQLWATLKSQPNLPDVEVIVKDKTFFVHKAILAARSKVFAAEFEKKQLGVPDQIRLDGVEPSTVEKFLHFIYTGEPMGTLADERLLELSDRYGLTTLTSLCKVALKKIDVMQMEKVRKSLNDNDEELFSSKIM